MRLFQDKTTVEIVSEVLTLAGLPKSCFRFALVEQYAPRNYCVQYRETDLAFVSRLSRRTASSISSSVRRTSTCG